jgi:hypothetical protein
MGTPRFTPEFKEEAVRQINIERGYSIAEVSERLGVRRSLYNGSGLLSLTTVDSRHRIYWMPEQKFSG